MPFRALAYILQGNYARVSPEAPAPPAAEAGADSTKAWPEPCKMPNHQIGPLESLIRPCYHSMVAQTSKHIVVTAQKTPQQTNPRQQQCSDSAAARDKPASSLTVQDVLSNLNEYQFGQQDQSYARYTKRSAQKDTKQLRSLMKQSRRSRNYRYIRNNIFDTMDLHKHCRRQRRALHGSRRLSDFLAKYRHTLLQKIIYSSQ